MDGDVDISIVTPSRNMREWLKLCHRSVMDQQGVSCEHIVQDAVSTDGTVEWLKSQPDVLWVSEPDNGMYDAVNKGLSRAKGGILAYLNCDEQYLPGALQAVVNFFSEHPDADVVFADAIVVDGNGRYICSRAVVVPELRHTVVSHLNTMSCAMFFRRSVIERGISFDASYRNIGDSEWVARLIAGGVKMAKMPIYASVFTETGSNWGLDADCVSQEKARLLKRYPRWWPICAPLWVLIHRFWRLKAGAYRPGELCYSIYTHDSRDKRADFIVDHPVFLWKARLQLFK